MQKSIARSHIYRHIALLQNGFGRYISARFYSTRLRVFYLLTLERKSEKIYLPNRAERSRSVNEKSVLTTTGIVLMNLWWGWMCSFGNRLCTRWGWGGFKTFSFGINFEFRFHFLMTSLLSFRFMRLATVESFHCSAVLRQVLCDLDIVKLILFVMTIF